MPKSTKQFFRADTAVSSRWKFIFASRS